VQLVLRADPSHLRRRRRGGRCYFKLGSPPAQWTDPATLIWPTDNSWCVATEVDFDSTLIAGDKHLIDGQDDAVDVAGITAGEPGDRRGEFVGLGERGMTATGPRESVRTPTNKCAGSGSPSLALA